MPFRFHFTDGALAQMEQMSLDQDAVRTVVHQGAKLQLAEGRHLCRHKGIEVEALVEGADVEVVVVRKEPAWPKGAPSLPYLQRVGGA